MLGKLGPRSAWRWSAGAAQPVSPVLGMPIGLEPMLVDGDVMVIPADGDQVLRVGSPTSTPGDDVVHLEPVPAVATVDDAAVPVTVDDGSS